MKITGYRIREAIKRWQLRRDTASAQFEDSIHAFEGEAKPSPLELMRTVARADSAIVQLQVAQNRFNLAVIVSVDGIGEQLTLLEAIKAVGGVTRLEKAWRGQSVPKRDRHLFRSEPATLRDNSKIVAKRTISPEDTAKQAAIWGATRMAYIEAIGTGNACEVDIKDLSPALLE